jgi:hypothetical protein
MRLSSKLLGPGERKKKQGDWFHLFVLTVSENAFALLSPVLFKLARLANTMQLESPLSCCLQNPPLKRHWLQEANVEVEGPTYPILVLELLGSTRPSMAIARRVFPEGLSNVV